MPFKYHVNPAQWKYSGVSINLSKSVEKNFSSTILPDASTGFDRWVYRFCPTEFPLLPNIGIIEELQRTGLLIYANDKSTIILVRKRNPTILNSDDWIFVSLGYPDSNQERQDQNLQCYHYTISQCRTGLLSVLRCNSYCFFVNNQNFSAVFCLAALFFRFSVQNSMFRQFLTIIFRTLLP